MIRNCFRFVGGDVSGSGLEGLGWYTTKYENTPRFPMFFNSMGWKI